jgi:hypothetical protein
MDFVYEIEPAYPKQIDCCQPLDTALPVSVALWLCGHFSLYIYKINVDILSIFYDLSDTEQRIDKKNGGRLLIHSLHKMSIYLSNFVLRVYYNGFSNTDKQTRVLLRLYYHKNRTKWTSTRV